MGGDASASHPLAGAGRSSADLLDLSTTEVHAGEGATSMAALAPLGVAGSRPRRHRGITLEEGHPLYNGGCSKSPVNQACRRLATNLQSLFVRCMDAANRQWKKKCAKGKRVQTAEPIPVPELSDEIVVDILVRLPVKSLLRCKSVCKGWRAIITDPFFVRAHLQRSASRCEQDPCFLITRYAYTGLRFRSHDIGFCQWQQGASMATLMHNEDFGSEMRSTRSIVQCDGLVLVPAVTRLYLFNPATRETITLPDSNRHRCSDSSSCYPGVGLDLRTGNHKVVRAFCRSNTWMMEVFTVSGNSNGGGSAWREIKYDLPYPAKIWDSGTAVNGFLFWYRTANHRDPQRPSGLLRLNLADETFGTTMLPDSVNPMNPYDFKLDVLHGELCLSSYSYICRDTVTMWFLPIQEDGGQGQTWEQRYTVHLTCVHQFRPLAFLPGDRMLLSANRKVCLYDMSTAKLTIVCQLDRIKYRGRRARTWNNSFTFHVHLYTGSLVRISA